MAQKCLCMIMIAILICLAIIAHRLGERESTEKQILSNVKDINWAGKMYTEFVYGIMNPKQIFTEKQEDDK